MTDSRAEQPADDEQLARIAAVKARRATTRSSAVRTSAVAPVGESAKRPSPAPKRKRHAALGGRIVAAGLGASGVLGLVAAFGIANAAEEATSADDPGSTTSTSQTLSSLDKVVGANRTGETIGAQRHESASAIPSAVDFGADPALGLSGDPSSASSWEPTPTPIYLTANPIVRTVMVQPPPVIVTVIDPAPVAQLAGAPTAPGQQGQPAPVAASPATAQAGPATAQSRPPQTAAPQAAAAPAAVAAPPVVVAPAAVVVQPAPAPIAAPAPVAPPAPTAAPAPAPAPPKTSGSG